MSCSVKGQRKKPVIACAAQMLRNSSLFSLLVKTQSPCRRLLLLSVPLPPKSCALRPRRHRRFATTSETPPLPLSQAFLPPKTPKDLSSASNSMQSPSDTQKLSTRAKKKARREAPENVLRHKLNVCSKDGDLHKALRLYDAALVHHVPLTAHHYNVLLYLCSSALAPGGVGGPAVNRGFEIFRQMGVDGIAPDEATFTSVARLAAANEDPGMAFDLIKQMTDHGIPPRLRSYGPALLGFCKKGDAEGAYAVDDHMASVGVLPEEPELAALIKVSSEAGRAEKVYEFLQRLRATMRKVSESTAEVLQNWFMSRAAAEAGDKEWDREKVKEGVVRGGGGWHGVGWLGSGEWNVVTTEMSKKGTCRACDERLVSIDIDPAETENFANSLANLACKNEARADFTDFQEWLSRHGPFEAVIDGANVGLYNQQNFSFQQLNSVVNGIRQMSSSKKLPLIVLHRRRVKGGSADDLHGKKLLEFWQHAGVLYSTPYGSNDDWYWLYAAVSCKCLLVTNDEMRDHLFQLLGTSFFPRWQEKHQVRLTFSKRGPTFRLPPPYSVVIQESEEGSWHIPTIGGDDIEVARKWVCASRNRSTQVHSPGHGPQ